MDAEDRAMFRDFRGEMREGFTGLHDRVDEVQRTINNHNEKQIRTDERLSAHLNDKAKHCDFERSVPAKAKDFHGVSVKLVIYVCAGIGSMIAGIASALAIL